jgi:hypothetical protein
VISRWTDIIGIAAAIADICINLSQFHKMACIRPGSLGWSTSFASTSYLLRSMPDSLRLRCQ